MTDIFFVLQPGVLMLDFAGPAEAFRIAGRHSSAEIRMHFIGAEEEVVTSLGLPVANVQPLPETMPDGALVFLMGITGDYLALEDGATSIITEWLRRVFDVKRHQLACVCAGALLAGRAGLLDGRRCTTHHSLTSILAERAPTAKVEENRVFVVDGPVMTSAGITAGTDLALHIIAELAGERVAMDVARTMVVYLRRSGDEKQQSPWLAHRNHLHPVIHRIQDMIAHDPARDWSLAYLADMAHMSPRHLTRLFRQETATSIVTYIQALRIALAKRSLAAGKTVDEAAYEAGFETTRSLRRLWPRFEKGTPGQSRHGPRP